MRLSIGFLLVSFVASCGGMQASEASPPANCRDAPAQADMIRYEGDRMCLAANTPAQPELAHHLGLVCVAMGAHFESGPCVTPDTNRARLYYRRACSVGYPPGCSAAARLGG
jgi:hypothetical protein